MTNGTLGLAEEDPVRVIEWQFSVCRGRFGECPLPLTR
jgi:hypothetical protein